MIGKRASKRGSPIYIDAGGETISLVPELTTRKLRFGGSAVLSVAPSAIYVIDKDGVRSIRLRRLGPRSARWLGIAGLLIAPLTHIILAARRDRLG